MGFHMTKSMITIQAGEPILNACKIMSRYRIGGLPVFEEEKLVGIVTDQALLRCMARGTNPRGAVREVCVPPLTLSARQTIHHAIDQLRQHHANYLLVLGADGSLQGLISQTNLLEASLRLLARAEARSVHAERLASRDPLTGLYTRKVFDEAFEDEFRRSQRYGGLLALLLIDLDHFKRVNDSFGHAAGDLVLKRLGQIVLRLVRRVDVPCRYGGDEFAILLPESGTRAAHILGERIRSALEQERFRHRGREFRVTLSGGISKRAASFEEAGDLFEEADRCLYKAKRAHRNCIEVSS